MNPTDLLDWPADPIGYAHTSLWPVRLVKEGFKVPGLRVSYANGLVVQGEHTWLATPLFNLHKRLGICTVHVYSASAQVPACMSCYQKRPGFRLPRLTNCWDCPPASVVSAYRVSRSNISRSPPAQPAPSDL